MDSIRNSLISKAFILPTGEISKDKINLFSGAVTPPFAETIWVMTDGDMDAVNRMTSLFTKLLDDGQEQVFMDTLRLLYDVMGLQFPEDMEMLSDHPEARQYFLFSFLLDIDDCMQDFTSEAAGE